VPWFSYSHEIGLSSVRTLGLITKPDALDKGSDNESYIELAQNEEVKLNLGWHVLRNRDYTTTNSSRELYYSHPRVDRCSVAVPTERLGLK
jgi:hypothetical protein